MGKVVNHRILIRIIGVVKKIGDRIEKLDLRIIPVNQIGAILKDSDLITDHIMDQPNQDPNKDLITKVDTVTDMVKDMDSDSDTDKDSDSVPKNQRSNDNTNIKEIVAIHIIQKIAEETVVERLVV